MDDPPQPPYSIVDAPDLEPRWGVMRQVRQAAALTAFGINEYVMPPGWDDYDEHDERKTNHVEMYFCLSGGGTITIDGTDVALQPDRYVFVRPECTRNVVAGPEGMRLLAVGVPDSQEFTGWDGL